MSIAYNHNDTKHMKIDVFFVREKVMAKLLCIYHILTLDQWAYVLIKPLSLARFMFLRRKLNVNNLFSEKSCPRV